MVRKLRDIESGRAGVEPAGALADAIRESAEKIWLAGLGAYASARRDPGGAFESLIRDGLALQARSRVAADERLQAARQDLGERTAQSWDRLERVFEQRIAAALERIGVASAAQVQALGERVDALATVVRELETASPAAPPRAATRRTTTAKAPKSARATPGKVARTRTGKGPAVAKTATVKGAKTKTAAVKGAKTLARKTPRR